jgi:hypothetical protein
VKRLRPVLASAGALVLATTLSACSWFNPHQTLVSYTPGAGAGATSGSVNAYSLVVVSDKAGGPGIVTGAVFNAGDKAASVGFVTKADGDSGAKPDSPLTLDAKTSESLSGFTLAKVAEPPGAMTTIYLVTDAGKTAVTVPVMPATGIYADAK